MKGVKKLERSLLKMKSHSYDAIDKVMKKICKEEGITPKQLHDNFKSAHNGQIPDDWIKDQTSTDNSEMDDQQFMCQDGKCGDCPRCDKKKEMMAIGYSEEAVDAVFEEIELKYGGKLKGKQKSLWENIHAKRKRIKAGSGERMRKPGEKGAPETLNVAEKTPKAFESGNYGKGLSEKQQDKAATNARKAMKAEKEGKSLKEQYKPWDTDKAYNKKKKESGKKHVKSKHTKKYEQMFGKDSEDHAEDYDSSDFSAAKSLAKKAKKSGFSVGTLRKVYQRGIGAWKSGHRPGMSPQAWAMARVNSFITGGGARKADSDLAGGKKKGDKGKRQGKNRKS